MVGGLAGYVGALTLSSLCAFSLSRGGLQRPANYGRVRVKRPFRAAGQCPLYPQKQQTRQRRSLSQREAIRAPGWAYWGKAQDKHRKACRSGDLLGRCDILEVEIRDAPGDKPAHFDSDFSAGRQAWPRCVHPMRRTTLRSLSKENASRHYKAKCGLWTDYSRSRRPMGVRKRHKLEMHGRLDWRGSCSWNWRTNARAIQVRAEGGPQSKRDGNQEPKTLTRPVLTPWHHPTPPLNFHRQEKFLTKTETEARISLD